MRSDLGRPLLLGGRQHDAIIHYIIMPRDSCSLGRALLATGMACALFLWLMTPPAEHVVLRRQLAPKPSSEQLAKSELDSAVALVKEQLTILALEKNSRRGSSAAKQRLSELESELTRLREAARSSGISLDEEAMVSVAATTDTATEVKSISAAAAASTAAPVEAEEQEDASEAAADPGQAEQLECSLYSGPMRWRWNPGGRGARSQRLAALPLDAAPALRPRRPPLQSFAPAELRLLPGSRAPHLRGSWAVSSSRSAPLLCASAPRRLRERRRDQRGLPAPAGARPPLLQHARHRAAAAAKGGAPLRWLGGAGGGHPRTLCRGAPPPLRFSEPNLGVISRPPCERGLASA